MKIICSRCLKNNFKLDFNQYGIISSRSSTSLLQIHEKFKSFANVFNFRIGLLQNAPILLQNIFRDRKLSSKTSVAQKCATFLVCWCLMAYDPIQTTQTRFDWYAVVAFA